MTLRTFPLLAILMMVSAGCASRHLGTHLPPIPPAMLTTQSTLQIQNAIPVSFAPMGPEVLNGLKIKRFIPWTAFFCAGTSTVTIAPERVYMAGAGVPWIPAPLATNLLTTKQANSFWNLVPEYMELLIDGVGVAGGTGTLFSISAKGLAKLAASSGIVHQVGKQLQSQVPNIGPLTAQLLGGQTGEVPTVLAAGQCATVVLYSGAMRRRQRGSGGAVAFSGAISLPQAVQ